MDPRKLTDLQLAQYRSYKGPIRIIGRLTIEKASYEMALGTRYTLRAWYGRALKSFVYYSYKTEQDRNLYAEKLIKNERERQQEKEQTKAANKKARVEMVDPFPVGTVFVNSWGYDQTNIDYYEVIGAKGCKLTLKRIKSDRNQTGWETGDCQPRRGDYFGEPIQKRIQFWNGKPHVSAKFGAMIVWDGTKNHWSSYA